MKVKICNLLRATTYLQLLAALFVLVWLTYDAIAHTDCRTGAIFFPTLVLAAALQAVYAIAVMRLIHHYAPSHLIPNQPFLQFYKLLVYLNTTMNTGLLIWFGFQFTILLQQSARYGISNPLQWLQLCIIASYAIVAMYTIAGAAKLKKAILRRREWQIESWLEEMNRLATA